MKNVREKFVRDAFTQIFQGAIFIFHWMQEEQQKNT